MMNPHTVMRLLRDFDKGTIVDREDKAGPVAIAFVAWDKVGNLTRSLGLLRAWFDVEPSKTFPGGALVIVQLD